MRILHCCLANFYIDNFGYQENVLPRVHKQQGHDVMILASTETMIQGRGLSYIAPAEYVNEDGIPVKRVPYNGLLPIRFAAKFRCYNGVSDAINAFSPDIIFMHDGQTSAVFTIVKYIKEHPNCRLFIDSHTDYVNSARNWMSKYLLHGILYKWYIKQTIPYTTKYYGTLPARVSFYRDFYGTPDNKTEYLPLGVDDLSVPFDKRETIKYEMREQLGISKEDFVIVTGGKLEKQKNTILLMQAYSILAERHNNLRLLLFGTIATDIKEDFDTLLKKDKTIVYVGWIPSKDTYKYFFASDLACFPGTHSTLWEESIGYGLPAIYKHWEGITQTDMNGNCLLIDEPITSKSLASVIESVYIDKNIYATMKRIAETKGIEKFSYSKIAEYCINEGASFKQVVNKHNGGGYYSLSNEYTSDMLYNCSAA